MSGTGSIPTACSAPISAGGSASAATARGPRGGMDTDLRPAPARGDAPRDPNGRIRDEDAPDPEGDHPEEGRITVIDATGRPQSMLVLGGSSELARAIIARLTPARGSTVVLAGRPGPRLEEAATGAKAAGAEVVETVDFEASDVAGHEAFVDGLFDRFGDLDLVLVAAGVLGDQDALEHDPEGVASLITTNFTGLAGAMMAIAGRLRRQGHGKLVVLSSVAGERARRANFVYGSSKAGLDAFCQGLGDALAGSGASVLIVRPGFVVGRMTEGLEPAPFATTPDAVADAVVRAVASGASVVYVPPVLRWVFAVMKHLPRVVWRRLPG